MNHYTYSLSRTRNTGDVRASRRFIFTIKYQYRLGPTVFFHRPLNETRSARFKQLDTQMMEYWGDGRARLCNTPFYFLPFVVRQIEAE